MVSEESDMFVVTQKSTALAVDVEEGFKIEKKEVETRYHHRPSHSVWSRKLIELRPWMLSSSASPMAGNMVLPVGT